MKITNAIRRQIIKEYEEERKKKISKEMRRRGKLGGAVNKKKGSAYFKMIRKGKRCVDK